MNKKKNISPYVKELNDLNGSKWTLHSKSVQIFSGPIIEKRKAHGAAFPLSLAKHFIEVYTQEGNTILDPFSGVGTSLDAANLLKRHSLGIELNPTFIKMFNEGIDSKDGKLNPSYKRNVINDSALNIGNHIPSDTIDMILTSPPYAGLLNNIREHFADKDFRGNPYKNQSRKLAKPYSTDSRDLGNIDYDEYLAKVQELFLKLHKVAKQGAYNVWVVRDYRDLKNHSPYINLHGDLITTAQQTGWVMWDLVVWDQSNQRKLVRLGGNKSRRYYFNIGHSFILVFRKNVDKEKF